MQRAGLEVNKYYRSEIDKYASQVAMHHYPDDVQLGDVTKWREWDIDWSSIDLLIGGSPCQGFSFAGKQAGTKANLNGVEILVTDRQTYLKLKEQGAEFLSQSHLFWEYVLILDHTKKHNPNVKFLLENVRMKKELLDMISNALGVKDVVINSSLVSAQNRHRHYWCNWDVDQPDDKGVLLRDIVENLDFNEVIPSNVEFKDNYAQWDVNNKGNKSQDQRAFYIDGKHGTLPANGGGSKVKVCGGAIIKVGNVNPSGNGMNGNVYALEGKAPTVTTNKGEGSKVLCGAMRGRYIVDGKRQDHKMKTAGLTEQRLEVRNDGKTNTLTTVQKDNVVVRATVQSNAEHTYDGKVPTITASMGIGGGNVPLFTDVETAAKYKGKYIDKNERLEYRKLTPIECERLQTLPDFWTDCISNTQRYKSLGNSWTVDVIAHIFKEMDKCETV